MKKLLTLFFFSFLFINAQVECPDGYIADCNGNCAPEAWIGEGLTGTPYCDDGTYSFNLELALESDTDSNAWCQGCEDDGYIPINFNCEEFDFDGGDCETDEEEEEEVVEECTETTVTCDGGSWQSEVSWSISSCDGEVIASGGAPFEDCLDLPDTYTIEMFDSYGDGWNGNTLIIGDGVYTIESGSENFANVGCETEEEEVVEECTGTTISSDGLGGWPEEVSWIIFCNECTNCDGEVLASGGAPFEDCVDLPDTFTIEMYDSYGDGWNGNTLVI